MFLLELFNEMAMIIPPLDSRLDTDDGNLELYNQNIKNSEKIDTLSPTIDLYQSNKYIMAIKNLEDHNRIIYYLRYERDNEPFIGHFVVQGYLWIDKKCKSEIPNLPKKIFFNLLDDYLTIVSDTEQTNDGIRFWRNRMNDAFHLGLNVYYADFENNKLKQLHGISDVANFDRIHNINSYDESSENRRFVISKRKLKVSDEY